MNLAQELFQSNLSRYEKKLSKLVNDGEGDGEAAKKLRDQIKAIASTANQYGNAKNQHVLNLIKNDLRANPRYDDPFDDQPHVFAFTNCAYDLTRQRGDEGWFVPDTCSCRARSRGASPPPSRWPTCKSGTRTSSRARKSAGH